MVFRQCDLSQADFRGATLKGADLRGSLLEGLLVGPHDLRGVIVEPAQAVRIAGLLGLIVQDMDEMQ